MTSTNQTVKEIEILKLHKDTLVDVGLYWHLTEQLNDFIEFHTQKAVSEERERIKDHLTSDGGGIDAVYKYLGYKDSVRQDKSSTLTPTEGTLEVKK